jgi:hypothetical protein
MKKKAASILLGVLVVVFILWGGRELIREYHRQRALALLAEADQLYDSGYFEQSTPKYEACWDYAPRSEKQRVLQRIVEFHANRGSGYGYPWVGRGLEEGIAVTHTSDKVKFVDELTRKERADPGWGKNRIHRPWWQLW